MPGPGHASKKMEGNQSPALTDDDEGHRDGIGQQVATHRLLVLAIAFAEEADQGVELVLTQTLWAPSYAQSLAPHSTSLIPRKKGKAGTAHREPGSGVLALQDAAPCKPVQ